MSELRFPSAWLPIEACAVALGVALDAAEMYSKTDAWRCVVDGTGPVYAIEDVRATARTITTQATPPILQPQKPDRRRGARPRWSFKPGKRS